MPLHSLIGLVSLFQKFLVTDCVLALLGFAPLAFLLLVEADETVAVGEEVAQCAGDSQWVDGTIELAVQARLEAVEEQHKLGNLQVEVFGGNDIGALFKRPAREFVLAAAVFREVVELWQQPREWHVVAVFSLDGGECGVVAHDALTSVVAYLLLVVGVVLDEELRPVTVALP